MVFSSPVFLFLFLPLVLALYFGLGPRLRNVVLLLTSLIFYAWGEQFFVVMMLVSIAGNYFIGLWVHRLRGTPRVGRLVGLAVVFNIGLLVAFKYGTFLLNTALHLGRPLGLPEVDIAGGHLPIGISFFTFQALSYVLAFAGATHRCSGTRSTWPSTSRCSPSSSPGRSSATAR